MNPSSQQTLFPHFQAASDPASQFLMSQGFFEVMIVVAIAIIVVAACSGVLSRGRSTSTAAPEMSSRRGGSGLGYLLFAGLCCIGLWLSANPQILTHL